MLHTRLCDVLGVEHPILNAPMAGSAAAELAAAVSAAGGFGLIGGTTAGGAAWLRAQIRTVRDRTNRPFGVGFISSYPGLDALVQVALEERVVAVSHSFADPTPYVAAAHAAGVKVLVQAQSVARAVCAAHAGADGRRHCRAGDRGWRPHGPHQCHPAPGPGRRGIRYVGAVDEPCASYHATRGRRASRWADPQGDGIAAVW